MVVCLFVLPLRRTGGLSRVYPASLPVATEVGSSTPSLDKIYPTKVKIVNQSIDLGTYYILGGDISVVQRNI